MTRQVINRGTVANDGTGDTLRAAALKIEQNFQEIYEKLGGDSSVLMPLVSFDSDHLILNGNTFDIKLGKNEPTADRTILLPDFTGEVIVDSAAQLMANKTVLTTTLVQPFIAESADAVHTFHIHAMPLSQYTDIYLPSLTDSDEFTFNDHTQTLNNKTINAALLNNPRIGTELQDSAGNQLIEFISTVGAVNHFKMTNATNGNTPVFEATGTSADIDLGLKAKGTGGVEIQSKLKLSYQQMTLDGAVDLTKPLTIFYSGSSINATMANGTETGEVKQLVNTGSGITTITPTSLNNWATITLDGSNTSCTLMWSSSTVSWIVINTFGDSANGILAK